ncbi:bifunctional DNA-binding transcriptional regulator/O6-methylguanine-DNA methyltransferase Ada [Ottowia sp.]|jgi:AraC family transcriptional regulator of adaptative response/methylated-DNA-[protein]-cysteine methyltransferase|uniref:bifunctional DNA-binding transcriptional regulator/O6-methylguanine-DNA methyltransferase Ada n=1 Tax=Ottowia sp. TaxID=1898956 RepID=UPI0025DFD7CB|nr:bifunctional DNA-binding transcriptional regulator/O6-methylguanine-DNA methyltransferase Ada [Ottowia sp.]MBK6614240.1 bifunctional DNA-binding transcriptional regulator/O6-methylguanine-DNA methyltransferase Ada [Ottowia sp.]MBK6745202.1 bifunctional DNA-binding transcriptional regulator/O6-methylguanine-DNA methyltransferase Ada [Ottowia sp.]
MTTPARPTESDPRWAAVLACDAAADGRFVYAVRTTGVWCHPSSPTRRPRPENVEFFDSPAAAEAAGYRPSRRADAGQLGRQHTAQVAAACRRIEAAVDAAQAPPTLDALAAEEGLSRFHFHRLFKAATGLTPRAYAAERRARLLRRTLPGHARVTDALYDAGFGASSRFYAQADGLLGMAPADFRAGGRGQRIRFAIGQCALGAILVAESARGLCAIALGDDPDALARGLQDQFPRAELVGGDAAFERHVAQVIGFVEAPGLGLDLPLDVRGTAFQQRVWQALRAVPAGSTVSYADIARRIGQPRAVRAVAQACAANPLAVAIPCHRVVRSDGALSGYRWGVERKRALQARERQAAARPAPTP